jgi:hypothetical protein
MVLKPRSQEEFDAFLADANVPGFHSLDSERWNEFIIAMRLDGGRVGDVPRERLVEAGFDEDDVGRLVDRLGEGLKLLEMWEADRGGPDIGMPGR